MNEGECKQASNELTESQKEREEEVEREREREKEKRRERVKSPYQYGLILEAEGKVIQKMEKK